MNVPKANNGTLENNGVRQARRFRRGIYLLPGALTVANLVCGYYAVLSTLKGSPQDMDNAAKAIGFAILFDMLDGFVARATGTNSEFGREFDSLADIVSFGVAPAFLSFAWGVRGMLSHQAPEPRLVYELGWLATFVFVICCAWRLARFNVHGMSPGSGRYFVGLPTPAAAGTIAAVVHAFWTPVQDWRISLIWLLVVLGISLLMVSTVRYASFKGARWKRRVPSLAVVLVALFLGAVIFYSEVTLLLLASIYVLQGIVMYFVRILRHRPASTEEPRTV